MPLHILQPTDKTFHALPRGGGGRGLDALHEAALGEEAWQEPLLCYVRHLVAQQLWLLTEDAVFGTTQQGVIIGFIGSYRGCQGEGLVQLSPLSYALKGSEAVGIGGEQLPQGIEVLHAGILWLQPTERMTMRMATYRKDGVEALQSLGPSLHLGGCHLAQRRQVIDQLLVLQGHVARDALIE